MKIRARDLSAIRIERAEFPSAGGTVRGLYYHAGAASTCVVLCHGYSASKHNFDLLALHLAVEGYAALTFDFLGHKLGASSGALREPADLLRNALDAVAWSRGRAGVEAVVIGGHSMGAATAIGAAAHDTTIAGIMAMCTALGRSRSTEEGPLVGGLNNRAQYVDGPPPAAITEEMDRYVARIAELAPRPLLVIAASRDAIVGPSAVRALFDAAREPKTFEIVDATHTDCAERARFVVARWLKSPFPPKPLM